MNNKEHLTDDEIINDPKLLEYVAIGSHPLFIFYDESDFAVTFIHRDHPEWKIPIPKQSLASLGSVVTRLGEKFTK